MMTLTGTVKSAGAYKVKGKDGSQKEMISMLVADEIGNTYSCQMWPDDRQYTQLAGVVDNVRYQRVQLIVKSYTARMRKMKDGTEKPQANFIMSDVTFPAAAGQSVA